MRLIIFAGLLIACNLAQSMPVKYTYQGKTYSGYVDNLEYSENINGAKFTLSNGHGFKPETRPINQFFFSEVSAGLQIYSIGAPHIAPGTVLTYAESIWSSTTFTLKHYGFGLDNGVRFLYFDLGELQ